MNDLLKARSVKVLPPDLTKKFSQQAEFRHQIVQFLFACVQIANVENPDARIKLVDYDFLKSTIQQLEAGKRHRLMVYQGPHFTAVEIDMTSIPVRAAILDAAGDPREFDILKCLEKEISNIIRVENQFGGQLNSGIQKDKHSCPLFALDHCIQLSNTDIFKSIPNKETSVENGNNLVVAWDDLPPNFVWNAQTTSGLEAYITKAEARLPGCMDKPIPPSNVTPRRYLENTLLALSIDNKYQFKARNEAININVLAKHEEKVKIYQSIPVIAVFNGDESTIQSIPPTFLSDKTFLVNSIKINPKIYLYIKDEDILNDTTFLLKALEANPDVFQYLSEKFKSNKEFFLNALEKNSNLLQYATGELKLTQTEFTKVVSRSTDAISFIGQLFPNDRDFLLKVCRRYPKLFRSSQLNTDKSLILEALEKGPAEIFFFVSDELKKDRSFILQAIKKSASIYRDISWELRGDEEILVEAIKYGYTNLFDSPELTRLCEIRNIEERAKACEQYLADYLKTTPPHVDLVGESLSAIKENANNFPDTDKAKKILKTPESAEQKINFQHQKTAAEVSQQVVDTANKVESQNQQHVENSKGVEQNPERACINLSKEIKKKVQEIKNDFDSPAGVNVSGGIQEKLDQEGDRTPQSHPMKK